MFLGRLAALFEKNSPKVVKIGGLSFIYFMRHLKHQKKTHALLAAEGHHVEKFREYRLNDIRKAVSKNYITETSRYIGKLARAAAKL